MSDLQKDIERMGFDAGMAHDLSEIVRITRESAIEECAKFVEQHQERITETSNGSERSVSPRMTGNQMGLAYVAGIRSLVGSPLASPSGKP